MKTLLICPAYRPAVAHLAENSPLVIAPLLGRCVLEYWIEALAARGAKHVLISAADRPNQVRAALGDGARWGLRVEVMPASREFTIAEARVKYRPANANDWLPQDDVVLIDHLPGLSGRPLFESYAAWFAAVQAWMPRAVTPARVGIREVQPGVWIGLHAQLSPAAQLRAPCWIGEYAVVGAGAIVGPEAILDDRAVVGSGARIVRSSVGPATFVGEFVSIENSLAQGGTLVNWQTRSCLRVPDAFLLSPLDARRFPKKHPGLPGRAIALATMIALAPFALAVIALSVLRGESPLHLRLAVRPQRSPRRFSADTFVYYELTGARNWLRRWPQFWRIVCGDLAWFGNRPLRPTQALALANDFERLWLTAPVGLISLADAHGCPDGLGEEACAHASFYAVNTSWRLDWFILSRALLQAALASPIRWPRRKDQPVPLPQLIPKQQG